MDEPLQPAMSFLPYAVDDVVAAVRAEFFPWLDVETPVVFAEGRPIACIVGPKSAAPVIHIHPALSRPDTPLDVLRFVVKHELLHIAVPSRVQGRRVIHHPPAFWEREYQIAPEAPRCWAWIHRTLGNWLVVNHGRQSAEVRVRRRRPGRPGHTIARLERSTARCARGATSAAPATSVS